MKKIATEEEREQLRFEADFLEGFFSVRYALSRESDVLDAVLIVLFTVIVSGSFLVVVFCLGYGWLWLWFLVVAFLLCLICGITHEAAAVHYEKNKALLLAAEDIRLNWVTIVNVDKDNRLISYIEDGALAPDNRKYIVDCIATPGDCKRVVKGERILIAYISSEEGKRVPLLMSPKPGFRLMSESRQCGPVLITGAEHIPHLNAFSVNRNEASGEEVEVLFCAPSGSCVIKPPGTARGSIFTRIYYYQWNGRSFVRKSCIRRQELKCDYGDILIKKHDRLGRIYFRGVVEFQAKEGKNK